MVIVSYERQCDCTSIFSISVTPVRMGKVNMGSAIVRFSNQRVPPVFRLSTGRLVIPLIPLITDRNIGN